MTREGGYTLLYQSETVDAKTPELARALERVGGEFSENISYHLPCEDRDRHLLILKKH